MNADIIFFHEYTHHLMFQDHRQAATRMGMSRDLRSSCRRCEFEQERRHLGSERQPITAHGACSAAIVCHSPPCSAAIIRRSPLSSVNRVLRARLAARSLPHVREIAGRPAGSAIVDMMSKGTPPLAAAQSAFGDLKQLDRELNSILEPQDARLSAISAASKFQTTRIDVRPLTPARREGDHVAHAVETRRQ